VSFDYQKSHLLGRAWLTLKPHEYPTDSLRLDAKGMLIEAVTIIKNNKPFPLHFSYDSLTLNIKLDRIYHNQEKYTVYVAYTARPNEIKGLEYAEHGLYFVNPDGREKGVPKEIFTLGEPEGSSIWFPTIDKPNQKSTSEIVMTVPAQYVTLSNGRLTAQRKNNNGTRTDTWKMDLPHAPYLFMMAVGDFKISKDTWRGKEVSYYLEPKYAPYARDIFGQVPEAMEFFSKITGVPYPWSKYAEIVVQEFPGALENTSATEFGPPVQATRRQLVDNYYECGIEHELFHQWFGDYVTAESWSNITLNESFADLGELLWLEHKYGKDAADDHLRGGMEDYLGRGEARKQNLVSFYYQKPKKAFGITYKKGGRVLNMLRNYLGDEAFFKGLHLYLTGNAFKSAEVPQLRMAFEEASGLDLNWFFNQWYYSAGHPNLDISYHWDETTKTESVYLAQKQDETPFLLPMAVDIYTASRKRRYKVWMRDKADTLTFRLDARPELVNVDADKVLVAQKTDHKGIAEMSWQYFHAPLYQDRFEAIDFAEKALDDETAQKIILAALNDPFSGLRQKAIAALHQNKNDIRNTNATLRDAVLPQLAALITNDRNTLVQADAIHALSVLNDPAYLTIFESALKSQSYSVQGAALNGIINIDPAAGMKYARQFEKDNDGELTGAIFRVYAQNGGDAQWPFMLKRYREGSLQDQVHLIHEFTALLSKLKQPELVLQGINEFKEIGVANKGADAVPYIIKFMNEVKDKRAQLGDIAAVKAVTDAIQRINETPNN
jgi:aminopeptidase N